MSNPLNCTEGLMRPNGLTSRRQIVLRLSTPRRNEIRTAEVIGSRCLARIWQSGCRSSTSRRAPCSRCCVDRLGLEAEFATRTYYDCLLSHAGCTTDADIAAALFPDGALLDRALQPGHVRLSGADDERNPAYVVRSGSIRVLRIDQVACDAWPKTGCPH